MLIEDQLGIIQNLQTSPIPKPVSWLGSSQVDIFTFLNNIRLVSEIGRRFVMIILTWLFDCDC